MMNNFNPMLLNILKSGNPQQMALNILMQQSGNNPIMKNVLDMANSNNYNGIEGIARNLCKSKGIDPDEMYRNIQNQFK